MYDLLRGIRIVEGASFVAAPLCGLTFVQLGADVIRFDPIGGGPDFGRWPLAPSGFSYYWEGLNKGKRSIALDLSKPQGREIAIALITTPGRDKGCFVTNYPATGYLAHSTLCSKRADLITVRVTGSSDGRNAVDYTVNCATGYPNLTGSPDSDQPVNHVLPAWDIATGLTAAVSLLAALLSRRSTGKGTEVQVPLSNVAFSTLSSLGNIGETIIGGTDRSRFGNALYGSFGRDFETIDSKRIMIVAITKRQWTALVTCLGLRAAIAAIETAQKVDFTNDEGARFTHRETLFALVEQETRIRTFPQLTELFDRHGVCWGEYQSLSKGLQNDLRLSVSNPMFQRITHPSGETYLASGYPGLFTGYERKPVHPAPLLGENTDEVLAEELGLGSAEIGRLHDEKIVGGA